jgi:hypothetical protein
MVRRAHELKTDPLINFQKGGRQMSFVPVKLIEEDSTPTDKTEVGTTPSWHWADIEDVLSAEWEIGGSAMSTDATRGLIADK